MHKPLLHPFLFETRDAALADRDRRNRLGGYFRVLHLASEPHPEFPGETRYLVDWDRAAADQARRQNNAQTLPAHQTREPQPQAQPR